MNASLVARFVAFLNALFMASPSELSFLEMVIFSLRLVITPKIADEIAPQHSPVNEQHGFCR